MTTLIWLGPAVVVLWSLSALGRIRDLVEDVRSAHRQVQMYQTEADVLATQPETSAAIERALRRRALTTRARAASIARARGQLGRPNLLFWAWVTRAETVLQTFEKDPL